jgi:hypothetical protein
VEVLAGPVARRLSRADDEGQRLLGRDRLGAKPPSSPTLVLCPASFSALRRAWKISAPIRRASEKVSAPVGMTMNSWMSIGLSAWAPPLMMFIMGVGSTRAETPPMYL